MTFVRSIIFGYLGAILGGLLVAVGAVVLNTPVETAAGAAAVTGTVFGILGFLLPWRHSVTQPVLARVRARR